MSLATSPTCPDLELAKSGRQLMGSFSFHAGMETDLTETHVVRRVWFHTQLSQMEFGKKIMQSPVDISSCLDVATWPSSAKMAKTLLTKKPDI
jgi:hypothetical protein